MVVVSLSGSIVFLLGWFLDLANRHDVILSNIKSRHPSEGILFPEVDVFSIRVWNGFDSGDIVWLLVLEFLYLSLKEEVGLLQVLDVLVLHLIDVDCLL
jgi:hypothetical protein